MAKRKIGNGKRRQKQKQQRASRWTMLAGALLGAVVLIAVFMLLRRGPTVSIPHVHGLGFLPDGELLVAAHNGLRAYADGEWSEPDVPAHDYMGFSMVNEGFFSSGHPAPGSTLPNPLGLVRSVDAGATLQQLAFLGESDFHLMGVGHQNHVIYVLNTRPNSMLDTGLYYSSDGGQTWQQSAAAGISDAPLALAVHPIEANIVALATHSGLLLSSDFGESFALVGRAELVTAATFEANGERLLFAADTLFAYVPAASRITELRAPVIAGDDGIAYIAINATGDRLALATFSRDIYLSEDGGQRWTQIAKEGRGK